MSRIGFWIALDNPGISVAEATTLLDRYGLQFEIKNLIGRLLIIGVEGPAEIIKEIVRRSANIKRAVQIFDQCDVLDLDYISYSVRNIVNEYINIEKETIAISALPHQSTLLKKDLAVIVRDIASKALKNMPVKINLDNPDKRIVILFPKDMVYIGIELVGKHKKGFFGRLPSKRPAKSPHALHPKLARAMVNLSGVMPGEVLLDPFCGVGSILIEASLLGIESIGIDIMYKWVSGASINMNWIGSNTHHLICGDSLDGLIRSASYVVTDPPYGRTTTLAGYAESKIIINKFLELASSIDSIRRIVFMTPKEVVPEIEKHGFKEIYKFEIPVHKNLVRVLRVIDYVTSSKHM